MCSPFTCGGFNTQDDDLELLSPCKYYPPKISKRSTSFGSRRKDSKNPYANRGLETFKALLADLDEKRQKIYKQIGFEDVSLVRFVYSNSNHVKPIVVKSKEKKSQQKVINPRLTKLNSEVSEKSTFEESKDVAVANESQRANNEKSEPSNNMRCCSICGRFKLEKFRQPLYYFPVVIMFILFFLAIYGQTFAILCSSIGWYAIPTIKGWDPDSNKPNGKKEYGRKMSEKKVVITDRSPSPKSVLSGPKVKVLPKREYLKKVSEKTVVTSEGLSSPKSVLNGPRDKSPRQHG